MANTKLSALASANGPLDLSDVFYLLRGGQSRKIVGSQMFMDQFVSKSASGNTRRSFEDRFDDIYNVMDFGAAGDGVSHPLSAGEATAYNTAYGAVGLTAVAGQERDMVAHRAMFLTAANTGHSCYSPAGTYLVNSPTGLTWTATPIVGQPAVPLLCRWYGDGRATVIRGVGIAAGRGVIEMLGESNGNAANIEISHMQIEQDGACHKYSFCLRLGDGYVGISLHRVICKGAQALALKVASSFSYAQLSFRATQCQFWSNWNFGWGVDAGLDVYSVVPESGGSYWDNCIFESCLFWGQVDCRSFDLKFLQCIFATPPNRALPFNVTVYLGNADFDGCYFEDALLSIATLSNLGAISTIAIRNSHFSSNNNLGPPFTVQSSLQHARGTYEHGPVVIQSCRFGGTASTGFDIDLYGPMSVSITDCCRPFGTINVEPTVNRNGDVRLIRRNPNGENPRDYHRFEKVIIDCTEFTAPATFEQDTTGQALLTVENPNVAGNGNAALEALSGTVSGKLLAFQLAHAVIPGYVVISNSEVTGTIAFGLGGPLHFFIEPTQVRANKSLNSGYGVVAENPNAGAAAHAFLYAYNGVNYAGVILFGSGHALAGEALFTNAANKKTHLGANGFAELTVDPADRRVKVRDWGILGGDWYRQTTTQVVNTTVAETVLTTGGIGQNTIPANLIQVGTTIELDCLLTEMSAGVVDYTYRFYIGATAFAAPVVSYGGALAIAPKSMRVVATVKVAGALGSMDWTVLRNGVPVLYGSQGIDTTGPLIVYLTVQPSVNDPVNEVTCPQATLKVSL